MLQLFQHRGRSAFLTCLAVYSLNAAVMASASGALKNTMYRFSPLTLNGAKSMPYFRAIRLNEPIF